MYRLLALPILLVLGSSVGAAKPDLVATLGAQGKQRNRDDQRHQRERDRAGRRQEIRKSMAPRTLAFATSLPQHRTHGPLVRALAATLPGGRAYALVPSRYSGWIVLTSRGELKWAPSFDGRVTTYDRVATRPNDGRSLENRLRPLTLEDVETLDNWTIEAGLQRTARRVASEGMAKVAGSLFNL